MADEDIPQVLQEPRSMIGGDGPDSYSQNSRYQKGVVDAAKGIIYKGITDKLDFKALCFDTSSTFRVADLGCSVGPNTFFAVENILEAVEHKYHVQLRNPSALEFQVFFNDVTDNDFNTLFKVLASYQKYFAAAVPGSFYGRLFPKSTIHLAHSSYSLHWLSNVPKDITDSKSPAWNKGSIQCSGFSKEVAEAYLAQYKHDMDTFLSARAEEIVGNGLLLMVIPSLPEGILMHQTLKGIIHDFLGSCLTDMAKLGVISEEKADSFNLPIYFASPKELEEIVTRNGYFSIERMETLDHSLLHIKKPSVEALVSNLRAIFEGLLLKHFGNEDIVEQIFQRYFKKLAENHHIFNEVRRDNIDLFILLKRKINE